MFKYTKMSVWYKQIYNYANSINDIWIFKSISTTSLKQLMWRNRIEKSYRHARIALCPFFHCKNKLNDLHQESNVHWWGTTETNEDTC